ncbi:MAG: exonuclease SbcCD subunit D [Lachnospiraceae bacterium]|nr:exonuclease SbcCD subunit D [Lachnospiraceae bacterium]
MRFIHLSDLHIGKQLHHYSLLEEQRDVLQQVVAYVKKEQPDALLIAGDIYDTAVPSAEAIAVFDEFLTGLDEVQKKLTICIIAGNHDSARRLDYASRILAKHAIHIVGMPPLKAEEGIRTVVMEDAYGEVAFYLLPFVKPGYLKKMFPEENLTFSDAVGRLLEKETLDRTRRNVLVSHQFYAGGGMTPVTSESEVHTVGGIDNVEVDVLKPFDYAALGHIHRAQKIGEAKNYYCGTIFPYSVSEADEEKFVTLVELQEKEKEPCIRKLPLELPRKVRKLRGTMEALLAQADGEVCHDYVSITLTDEVEASHPRERLEEYYDHILEIKIDNARTRKLLELGEIEAENMAPYEAFCKFFFELNGRELTEAEDSLLKAVLQEGGDME